MRVVMVSNGTRGDVEPYLGLGLELAGRGHEAVVATQAHFEKSVTDRGLGFYPVQGDILSFSKDLLEAGENFRRAMSRAGKMLRSMMRDMFEDTLEACRGADVVVYGPTGYPGRKVAQYLGIPAVGSAMQPMFYPTGRYCSSVIPELPPRFRGLPLLGDVFNRASYAAARQMFWQPMRPSLNKATREVLGLRSEPFLGPYSELVRSREPWLNAWSPAVLPSTLTPRPGMHTVGYWYPRGTGAWRPPEELVDFLESGPAPVSVGFGSMSTRHPEKTTEAVLGALEATGSRGVLLTGWGGIDNAGTSDDVFVIDEAPHAWLFERVRAAVHHGGAGTTAASLTAGLPTVIVPHFADQRFWGRRVAALGAGPPPIADGDLTAESLARAIRAATEDLAVAKRAADVGRRLRSEEGSAVAVAIIEQHASAKRLVA